MSPVGFRVNVAPVRGSKTKPVSLTARFLRFEASTMSFPFKS